MEKLNDLIYMVGLVNTENWEYSKLFMDDTIAYRDISMVDEGNELITNRYELIYDDNGYKIGFIYLLHYPSSDTVEITYIYIQKNSRHLGHGEKIIRELLNKKHKRYIVSTKESDLIKLLNKVGFKFSKKILMDNSLTFQLIN